MNSPLLEVRGLKKHFPVRKRFFSTQAKSVIRAVDGIDFVISRGETLALVGESGCGKTTTAKLILLLEEKTAGNLIFDGKEVQSFQDEELRHYRSSVQAVFQDPFSSLNPRMRVGSIISEPVQVNRNTTREALAQRTAELLTDVGLSPEAAKLYPHQFSGGQRQRIAVARALALMPKLIILDEPVSALDVSIQAQLMNMLRDLQDKWGGSYLLIAHNLATVRYISNYVAVMYLGKIVEIGECDELYTHPLHPYTKALFSAALPSHPRDQRNQILLSGEVPSPANPPPGCRFHPRCDHSMTRCRQDEPSLRKATALHSIACHLD